MPTLIIKRSSNSFFRCGVQGWLSTEEEKRQWTELTTLLLRRTLAERALVLITVAPAEWSIARALPVPRVRRRGGTVYIVNRIASCDDAVAEEIAQSEDFVRGLLWILPEFREDDDCAIAKAQKVELDRSEDPVADCEFLVMQDDGRWIHWLRPNGPTDELSVAICAAASELHWDIEQHHE